MSFVSGKTGEDDTQAAPLLSVRQMDRDREAAVNWVGTTDGEFDSAYYHSDCRAAEITFKKHAETDLYADEWQGLSDAEPKGRLWLEGAGAIFAHVNDARTIR